MAKKLLSIFFALTLVLNILNLNLKQASAEDQTSAEDQASQQPSGPLEVLEGAYPGIGPKFKPLIADPKLAIALYISRIVQIVLGIVGIILFLVILYGGFLWMTAGGNEEQITKAKKWLKNGVIGIIIIITAYTVSAFIIQQLTKIGAPLTPPPASSEP